MANFKQAPMAPDLQIASQSMSVIVAGRQFGASRFFRRWVRALIGFASRELP
jgi:hypothetical protein